MTGPLLRAEDVARQLAISKAAVYRLIEAGDLEAVRIGERVVRVSETALENFVTERTTKPAASAVRRIGMRDAEAIR